MTRNRTGMMSNRSDTSSPITWRSAPQPQIVCSGSITSSMRGRCLGSDPRLVLRGLAGRDADGSRAASSAWIAAIAVSMSSSASSYCSGSPFRPRAKQSAFEVSNELFQLINAVLLAQIAALRGHQKRLQGLNIIRKISRFEHAHGLSLLASAYPRKSLPDSLCRSGWTHRQSLHLAPVQP